LNSLFKAPSNAVALQFRVRLLLLSLKQRRRLRLGLPGHDLRECVVDGHADKPPLDGTEPPAHAAPTPHQRVHGIQRGAVHCEGRRGQRGVPRDLAGIVVLAVVHVGRSPNQQLGARDAQYERVDHQFGQLFGRLLGQVRDALGALVGAHDFGELKPAGHDREASVLLRVMVQEAPPAVLSVRGVVERLARRHCVPYAGRVNGAGVLCGPAGLGHS
jgi:hypothetical protein